MTENKLLAYHPLAMKVLTIAVMGEIGDWAAYVDAVPGISHKREALEMLESGNATKLPKDVAKLIYGRLSEQYTWRE